MTVHQNIKGASKWPNGNVLGILYSFMMQHKSWMRLWMNTLDPPMFMTDSICKHSFTCKHTPKLSC